MTRLLLIILISITSSYSIYGQVAQINRFEMEKKNTDDFFTVAPAGELGLLIIRDTNKEFSFKERAKGDTWEVTGLDTTMTEMWKHELSIAYGHSFKAYDVADSRLYLLFRDGEFEKNDYHLITIEIDGGEVNTYDIENEVALDLSHITVVDGVIVLAGYVRYSPTLVNYKIGESKFEIIPGFFKDRSDVIDLRSNNNGTFNVLTLEKGYGGFFIRLRTHSKDGTILFEREIEMMQDHKVLSGKTTGFIDGNIAITGTFGAKNSYYSQGIYFAIAKPEGQPNVVSYINFTDLEHFFDYMRPRRAERIREKVKRREVAGKDYDYRTRLLMHDIDKTENGFLVSAEVYDPRYDRTNRTEFQNSYFDNTQNYNFTGANYQYVRQPNRLVNVDGANHFEFLESIVLHLDKQGKLKWDQSLKIEDVEAASLAAVTDVAKKDEQILMLYRNEENISYKYLVDQDSSIQATEPIKLNDEYDEIKHNYDLIGGTEYWYGNHFFVWGYHKVENKVAVDVDKRRNVLFINKVRFE
ncbi:hypothetical protein E1176_13900 [Fulvivirga sp. RKSG066]|uniref:hypothetical protein n=1 Tax=Fulvivirga aurantia TaxID=2529383 RepID=UPI0012BCC04F|nr:hypothetical protein [Fulvivirga aurantia]MTI22119.1 hypothetical protein [Fulvivirga aurantia]